MSLSDLIEHNLDALGELPDAEPFPVRFRWLKRLLIGGGALLLLLVAVRLWWGWEAHRRFQAEIDKCIAAGEPIYPADFNPKEPLSDDRNAAKFLIDAATALTLTIEQERLIGEIADGEVDPGQRLDELRDFKESSAVVIALVRDAALRPESDWGLRFASPAIFTMVPDLSGQRRLSKTLNTLARYEHASGDIRGAVETLELAWMQTSVVDGIPSLIPHLVAIACRVITVRSIESMAPALAVGSAAGPAPESYSAVSRATVEQLIRTMLDESRDVAALRRALQSERVLQVDIVQGVLGGQWSVQGLVNWVTVTPSFAERTVVAALRPVLECEVANTLNDMTRIVGAVDTRRWSAVESAFGAVQERTREAGFLVRPLANAFEVSSLERAVGLHYRQVAERRMAAVALAIRLYELDHGRRPAALAELLPDYLESIPADPFAENRPISYAPDADRPILYSIGGDGIDNDGAFNMSRSGWVDYGRLDLPFFLDGDRLERKE